MSEKSVEAAPPERERWSSRYAFYFAAIGSAVGFGNVWRFPSLVYEYGGGAFFIPYVLALVLIGMPLLVLEISLGQYYQTGDVNVFGSIHRRLRGVGLSSVACGYMLVVYYSMLIAWVINAFFDSFGSNFWTQDEVTGTEAKGYFYNEIIGMSTLGEDNLATRMIGKNVGYSFLVWAIVYLCVAFGIKWTGRIAYVTMGLPIVLLFVFLGRSLTLEGSQQGIDEYIRDSNWSVLTERPDVWSRAVSQIFFSLGVTFGIMTAYGSHCKRDEPAFKNACVIATCNSLFSFVSGFAVFACLGHLVHLENLDSVKDLEYSTFGLVFGSWPVSLGTLPGGEHWIRLLFFMLFLLGIDSAFSFIEGFLCVLNDTKLFQNVPNHWTSLGLCVSGWLFSLIYATDAGLIWLDTIDYYINFVMLLVGGFECFGAGWIYRIEDQIESLGANIVFSYMTATFGSVILACIVWFSLNNSDPDTALWAGFVALIGFYVIGMILVIFTMKKKMAANPGHWTWKSMFYELTMKNVMDLRSDLSQVVGYIPAVWGFLIKHFIPSIIIVLFALGCDTENKDGTKVFGNYGGYVFAPYQIMGLMTVVFAGFLFLSSMVFPSMYNALALPNPKVPERKCIVDNPEVLSEKDAVYPAEDESQSAEIEDNTKKPDEPQSVEIDDDTKKPEESPFVDAEAPMQPVADEA